MINKVKILIFLALAGICTGQIFAQKPASEYDIKAAFLYNFIKFVEWPSDAFYEKDAPITIGVLSEKGENPFIDTFALTNYLDGAVHGKTLNDRKIKVRESEHIIALKDCQLIFISRSEKSHLREIFNAINGRPILTVGDTDNFCQQGGMINFIQHSGKVRFEINLIAAEKARLKISSKLLNVATLIETQKR
jgi:hypothetical protein